MADTKSFLLGAKSKKAKTRILIHRKTNKFADLVRLVREAHTRTTASGTKLDAAGEELVQV